MFDFTNNVIFDKNCNNNTTTAIYNSPMISNMNICLPLNNGHSFHTNMELTPENCPKHSSRKYRGIPQKIRKKKNGIKKAPINSN